MHATVIKQSANRAEIPAKYFLTSLVHSFLHFSEAISHFPETFPHFLLGLLSSSVQIMSAVHYKSSTYFLFNRKMAHHSCALCFLPEELVYNFYRAIFRPSIATMLNIMSFWKEWKGGISMISPSGFWECF